jgi:predicted GTPase
LDELPVRARDTVDHTIHENNIYLCHLAEQTAISLLRPDMPTDSELLKVAIVGTPNAGKSTFVNRLMGWRVSLINR